MSSKIIHGDCVEVMKGMEPDTVDLVFTSPPYEDARTYGTVGFNLKGEEFIAWAFERFEECLRVCKGPVCWVINGRSRNGKWSCTAELLTARIHEAGYCVRAPMVFHRVGIPGSGGPDWFRRDHESIVCATREPGRLPWSDNTACGHPPKWAPGGEMSYRVTDGSRVNQWGHSIDSGATTVSEDGVVRSKGKRPSHSLKKFPAEKRDHTKRRADGSMEEQHYSPPAVANPGSIVSRKVGGGHMGSKLAHKHHAPFPESLAEFFVKSLCPSGGIVLDPFSGSGTTAAVAVRHGRNYIAIDIAEGSCDLTRQRVGNVQMEIEAA